MSERGANMPTVHHLRSGLLAAIFLAAGCEYGDRRNDLIAAGYGQGGGDTARNHPLPG